MTAVRQHLLVEAELVNDYANALAEIAINAREDLESKIDTLISNREAAETALERCRCACSFAERWLLFAARIADGSADPEAVVMAVEAITELMAPTERPQ